MFFNKKSRNKCENCNSKINDSYSFCPYCGETLLSQKRYEDYGLLGTKDSKDMPKNDFIDFGITDKFFSSMINNLMKTLDKQLKHLDKEARVERAEIRSFPNGIKIKISPPIPVKRERQRTILKKNISEQQLGKMSSLPRTAAKTKVKRLGDKVIYELNAPGIESAQDVFVSKLESGYEIKAIGNKKVYVNSIPINLPLNSYSIIDNKLYLEFKTNSF